MRREFGGGGWYLFGGGELSAKCCWSPERFANAVWECGGRAGGGDFEWGGACCRCNCAESGYISVCVHYGWEYECGAECGDLEYGWGGERDQLNCGEWGFYVDGEYCGSSLASQVGCTVAIAFKPAAAGSRTGTLIVTDDLGTQTAALSGSGVAAATDGLSPLALTFATQQVGTASVAQQVTLTNTGDVALTLIAAQITAGDFIAVNSCGNSLNARSSCTIGVQFAPRSVGLQSGLMTVTDQFRVQTVVLNGTGAAAAGVSISPVSPVGFGVVAVGGSSTPQNVTITNNGGSSLSLQSIVVAGDFTILGGSKYLR